MDYRDFIQQPSGEIHFWHKARLNLIHSLCERAFNIKKNRTILDVGCGTGTEMPLLSNYGEVSALDTDERALGEAHKKGYKIIVADLASQGAIAASYDAVCAFDVLEHIDNDVAAISNIYEALQPGGSLLITVPAYQWLYSEHDKALEHFRRYSKGELLRKLKDAGFIVEYVRYWNTFLFPAVACVRFIKKFKKARPINHPTSEAESWGPFIDPILYWILSQEADGALMLLRFLNFGLSISVIAKKP